MILFFLTKGRLCFTSFRAISIVSFVLVFLSSLWDEGTVLSFLEKGLGGGCSPPMETATSGASLANRVVMKETEETAGDTSSEDKDGQDWLASGFGQDDDDSEERLMAALKQRERIEARHWSLNAMQQAEAEVDVEVVAAATAHGKGAVIHIEQVVGQQQMMVWDCSLVLSRFLEKYPKTVRDKKVVELGCGVGLPGMFSKVIGASSVLLTERPGAISFIQKQIDNNRNLWQDGQISARPLEWGCNSDEEHLDYDVVLCSDLIYAGDYTTTESLARTIGRLTLQSKKAVVISAYENRHVGVTNSSTSSSEEQQTFFNAFMELELFDVRRQVPFEYLSPECRDENIVVNIYTRSKGSWEATIFQDF